MDKLSVEIDEVISQTMGYFLRGLPMFGIENPGECTSQLSEEYVWMINCTSASWNNSINWKILPVNYDLLLIDISVLISFKHPQVYIYTHNVRKRGTYPTYSPSAAQT